MTAQSWSPCRPTASVSPDRGASPTLDPTSYVDLGDRSSTARSPGPRRRPATGCSSPTWQPRLRPGARGRPAHRAPVVRRRPLQRRGLQAVIDFWEDTFLDRRLRGLLRAGRRLPLRGLAGDRDRGDHLDAADARGVRERAGYDLRPFLPVVLEVNEKYRLRLRRPVDRQLRTPGPRRLQPGALRPLPRPPPAAAAGLRPGRSAWACGCSPTASRSTRSSTPRCSTSPRPSRSASRTSTTTASWPAAATWAAGRSCPARRSATPARRTTRRGGNSASPTHRTRRSHVNSIFAAGVNQAMIHGFPYARRARRHLAGLRRLLALLQRRDRLRRGVGAAHPAVAARARHRRLPRPHPAGAADRHAEVRRRLPAPEGLGRPPASAPSGRPTTASRSAGPTRSRPPALLDLPLATVRGGRLAPDGPAYKVDDHRHRPVPRPGRHDGRRDRANGCSSSAAPGCRSSSSATGRTPRPSACPTAHADAEVRCADWSRRSRRCRRPDVAAADADIPGALAALGITPRRRARATPPS